MRELLRREEQDGGMGREGLLWVDPDEVLGQLPEYRMSMNFTDFATGRRVAARDAADACHAEAFHIAVQVAFAALNYRRSFVYHGTGACIALF